MGQRPPAVVGLYLRESRQWRRIAEFRLTADGHASFRAVDPVEGLVARVWYHQGVDILGEERTVLPDDGPAFLRALLQPFGFRDYRFRDDSRTGAHGANGLPRNGHGRPWHDTPGPAGDSECVRCAENDHAEATGRGGHGAHRPAAWQALDADTIRFTR
ncbi:hypothetical protein [Nocardia sp. NPDC006630]|uniref:hypothetical protein n=1 Tax=Nocardia sp. NPDC006630 TaxID=3157181 RepID=UPI0033B8EBDA